MLGSIQSLSHRASTCCAQAFGTKSLLAVGSLVALLVAGGLGKVLSLRTTLIALCGLAAGCCLAVIARALNAQRSGLNSERSGTGLNHAFLAYVPKQLDDGPTTFWNHVMNALTLDMSNKLFDPKQDNGKDPIVVLYRHDARYEAQDLATYLSKLGITTQHHARVVLFLARLQGSGKATDWCAAARDVVGDARVHEIEFETTLPYGAPKTTRPLRFKIFDGDGKRASGKWLELDNPDHCGELRNFIERGWQQISTTSSATNSAITR
ncbi:MAG: hypothetical protein ACOYKZ_01455 [Chlamydiia bacterium]